MRIKSKYLWVLGLLPGSAATAFAQTQAEQVANVAPIAYNQQLMHEREVVVGADGFEAIPVGFAKPFDLRSYNVFLPSNARERVTSSAYSSSPPTGMP